jgi:hypothetical protein
MTGPLPFPEHDVVLAGVKAKPYGRPPSRPRHRLRAPPNGNEREQAEDQDPPISGLYGLRGLPQQVEACRLFSGVLVS